MRRLFMVFLVLSFCLAIFILNKTVKADLDSDIAEVSKQYNEAVAQLNSQTGDLQKISAQLEQIKTRIVQLGDQIQKGEEALTYQKELLNQRVKSYYKNVNNASISLVDVLVSDNLSESLRKFFYQKSLVDEDKKTIIKVVLYIKDLENQKTKLAALKVQVDQQSKDLLAKIDKTKQQIATLSSRQQQLIAQKLASLNISRSASSMGRCDSDLTNGRDPGFSPRLAVFTYGVPHRNGLNQYGAWGRAKDSQNEEKILQEYYPNLTLKKDYDHGAQINVEGYGTFSIEDYVKRIYEMPDSWTDNNLSALKAQAVAARTYALNTMQRKGSICTTESCQVFKPEPKGGNWEQAVNSTAGWVLMDGGTPGFTQYASTHGGYILSLGKFDGKNGNPGNFGELNDRAYDKESPWFYCDWGSRTNYNKTAWLKPEELGDIVNVIMLARSDSSTTEHLYQADSPPSGVDVWSADKVKQELRNRGGNPLDSVSDVSVSADFGSGRTTTVTINGRSFDGAEFKNWFNLRAPANIQIVGPLYNVEKR